MGQVYRTQKGTYNKSSAFKKVYLELEDKVDTFLIKP
jgi:hypothetical protein